jgi:hypothetical protein
MIRVKAWTTIGGNDERQAEDANLAKKNARDGGASVR